MSLSSPESLRSRTDSTIETTRKVTARLEVSKVRNMSAHTCLNFVSLLSPYVGNNTVIKVCELSICEKLCFSLPLSLFSLKRMMGEQRKINFFFVRGGATWINEDELRTPYVIPLWSSFAAGHPLNFVFALQSLPDGFKLQQTAVGESGSQLRIGQKRNGWSTFYTEEGKYVLVMCLPHEIFLRNLKLALSLQQSANKSCNFV